MTSQAYPIDGINQSTQGVLKDLRKNQASKEQQERLAEKFARWLFETFGSFRHLLAFLIILALTYISIRFNYELGQLNSVDDTSRELLPLGYALLDMAGLFLSGYIGVHTASTLRRCIAWGWFAVLLSLSLWAAASFTLSVDSRLESGEITTQIESKKDEIKIQTDVVATWQEKFNGTTRFVRAYGAELKAQQAKLAALKAELAKLEGENTAPALAIYERVAPHLDLESKTLVTIVKLIWAAAMTLSPLILMLLVAAEIRAAKRAKQERGQDEQTPPSPTKPTGNNGRRERADRHVSSDSDTTTVPDVIQPKNRTSMHNTPRTQGLQRDTGTVGKAGNRYEDVKNAVLRGTVRPSVRKIREYSSCSQPIAQRYISEMADEGIIEPHGQGYRVKKLRSVQ